MRQFVKQVVDRNGGELISTQIVQQDEEGAQNSARLRVHLRTDLNASAQILYLLESGKPLLFLDKLTISSRLVRGAAKAGSPQVSLDMNFDVTGFLQEGA
jgi:general secretion pathway protein M